MARTVLVTGASRGIGRAIALGMADAGYDVAVNDIEAQADALRAVSQAITERGRRATNAIADVSIRAEVEAMISRVHEWAGELDVLVNNAGILLEAKIDALDDAKWDAVYGVNVKGVFLVTQAVLPAMRARRHGRIVNIASIGGKHGGVGQAHYAASKAAVMGFTRVLAQEVGPDGVTANCVCPGIISTEMGRVNLADPANVAHWERVTFLRRIGQPEDVVGAVCFFASDGAAFITGQSLNVDGGIVLS